MLELLLCAYLSHIYLSVTDVIDKDWDFKRLHILFSSGASNKKCLSSCQDFHHIAFSKMLGYLLGKHSKR